MPVSEIRVMTPLSGSPDAYGFYARAALPDGTEVALVPRTFGRVALPVGPPSLWTGYDDEYLYEDSGAALASYIAYLAGVTRSPEGWRRHVSRDAPTRRRRSCAQCGRITEYGDDEDGCAEEPPACHSAEGTHGADAPGYAHGGPT